MMSGKTLDVADIRDVRNDVSLHFVVSSP